MSIKLFKNLILASILGTAFLLTLSLVWVGRAAPTTLPSCGHNAVFSSSGLVSGPPDIAVSQNAAETYTAVVWSGDQLSTSDRGSIKLAYSKVQTTTRTWTQFTVDGDTDEAKRSIDPTIVFDPDGSDTVHIAYRKGQGIYYKKCDLESSSCSGKNITDNTWGGLITHDVPQITVMANTNTVVIVYYENDQSLGKQFLQYATIANKGAGAISPKTKLTSFNTNGKEENPTAVYSNGKVHIAYTRDPATGSDSIEYVNLEATGSSVSLEERFDFGGSMTEPRFPAIDARGGKVVLVWELKDTSNSKYSLVYNKSADNGDTWEGGIRDYRYLFTNKNDSENGKAEWNTEASAQYVKGLQPDVAIDEDGYYHVVWQAKEDGSNIHDILYTKGVFITSPFWKGNDNISTTPISYTNVTEIYRIAEFSPLTASKVKAKIHFGQPNKRMQVVYMSASTPPSSKWDIFYNGWQLGQGENPPDSLPDSDCDWIPDEDEKKECLPGADCDDDGIPNYMDDDSDGDGADDYLELQAGTNPYDASSKPPTVYLPTILKS